MTDNEEFDGEPDEETAQEPESDPVEELTGKKKAPQRKIPGSDHKDKEGAPFMLLKAMRWVINHPEVPGEDGMNGLARTYFIDDPITFVKALERMELAWLRYKIDYAKLMGKLPRNMAGRGYKELPKEKERAELALEEMGPEGGD